MKRLWFVSAFTALVVGTAVDEASAQSSRSPMGPEARASITIRVSVSPTFSVSAPAKGLEVSSNASPQLRYAYLLQPARPAKSILGGASAEGTAPQPGVRGQQLLLIVPD